MSGIRKPTRTLPLVDDAYDPGSPSVGPAVRGKNLRILSWAEAPCWPLTLRIHNHHEMNEHHTNSYPCVEWTLCIWLLCANLLLLRD